MTNNNTNTTAIRCSHAGCETLRTFTSIYCTAHEPMLAPELVGRLCTCGSGEPVMECSAPGGWAYCG